MVELGDLTGEEKLAKKFWLNQAEQQFKRDVFERDGGVCVCGAPIEVIHHLLGREKKSVRYKSLTPDVKVVWTIREGIFNPHIELNGRGLCRAHHVPFAHGFRPVVTKLLLLDILNRKGDIEVQGRPYWAWYALPPFLEFLR